MKFPQPPSGCMEGDDVLNDSDLFSGETTVSRLQHLDHLVLPVGNLDRARKRYDALGFTVAPDGAHPFGTVNCCVYFQDGTFLEPLAIADPKATARAVGEGNEFIRGDRIYRDLVGEEGFEAVVLATDDARADHSAFVAAGISGGNVLDFSRPSADASGKADIASFRLAFARDGLSPAPYFFACQRVAVPKVDRAALQVHANGVESLKQVLFVSRTPREHVAFLEAFSGGVADIKTDAISVALPNVRLDVFTPQAAAQQLGMPLALPSGLHGMVPVAVTFGVRDIPALESLFKSQAISYLAHDGVLAVPPAAGQGCHFLFEAST